MKTIKKRGGGRPRTWQNLPTPAGRALAYAIAKEDDGDTTNAAAELGCSVGMVSLMVHGKKIPGRKLANKIEERYGVSAKLWDLETGTPAEPV